jgi:hypothetical protein
MRSYNNKAEYACADKGKLVHWLGSTLVQSWGSPYLLEATNLGYDDTPDARIEEWDHARF